MPEMPQAGLQRAADWLQEGRVREAQGRFEEAMALYDQAIAAMQPAEVSDHPARRMLGVAWMNRGNALQQLATAVSLADAVNAYDAAIAVLETLPLEEPLYRNHLGAAWLNRGHALLVVSDASGVASFEQAIFHLRQLPVDTDPHYRLNLAGAWTNLANARLGAEPARAAEAARAALAELRSVERSHEVFAFMSLRARRALVMALGEILRRSDTAEMVSEATDAIDDGLAIVRGAEVEAAMRLRPLAARLYRLGAQLYGMHQPHFLGEFLLEQLHSPVFADDAEFRAVAEQAVAQALAALHRPQIHVAGAADTTKALATVQALRAAQQQIAGLPALSPNALPASPS